MAHAPLWTEATPRFAVDLTGLSPEAARLGEGAQLSLYLYHIEQNPASENLFWTAQSQSAGGPPSATSRSRSTCITCCRRTPRGTTSKSSRP